MKHTILLSAFSCLPDRGSEPGVGWNWALQAAKTQNVYLLTRTKCKKKIEPKIPKELRENLHFVYCDSSSKLREKSIYLEYIHWQWKAYKFAKELCKKVKFDYVVHLTFGNLFLPMWMHKLGVPFIWGPLGGGERVDKRFYKNFSFKERLPHIIKDFMVKTVSINPFVIEPAKKAKLIIARTEDTKNVFPKRFHNKINLKLETCLDSSEIEKLEKYSTEEKFNDGRVHLIVTGRLIAFKNNLILIDVMKELKKQEKNVVLHIVGEGNQKNMIIDKIKKCQLNNSVIMHGQLSREETLKLVKMSDIFVFPSLREGGSWSLMEGMLLGKPIVCLDTSGMHIITNDSCAIRIKCNSTDELINKFQEALIHLIKNPEIANMMGECAKNRILSNFNWKNICDYIRDTLDLLDNNI